MRHTLMAHPFPCARRANSLDRAFSELTYYDKARGPLVGMRATIMGDRK